MLHELHQRQQLLPVAAELCCQGLGIGEGRGQGRHDADRHVLLISPVSLDRPVPLKHGERRFQPPVVPATGREPIPQPGQAEGGHRIGLSGEQVVDPLVDSRLRIAPLDELHLGHEVALVVEQEAFGGLLIPSGPTDLLIPRLHRARHFGVDHEPDVVFVDPHPEGIGRQHQSTAARHELRLHPPAGVAVEIAMVGVVNDALLPQQRAEVIERADQREVDDPAAQGSRGKVPADEIEDRRQLVVVAPDLRHRELQIGPIDALVKHRHLFGLEAELPHDVGLNRGRGRGREGHGDGLAEQSADLGEPGDSGDSTTTSGRWAASARVSMIAGIW